MPDYLLLLISALLAVYLLSVILGRYVIRRLLVPLQPGWKKYGVIAAVRALLFTPTLTISESGVVILPAAFALIFSDIQKGLWVWPAPIIVFAVSLLFTYRRIRLVHASSEA
ncbi:hypothetical protein [Gilvimarinus sp. 1_MG-2023]|uniref:hypothetical protein n=1 Tax=Gilvimarinus sp. 1_MG-2023 TaxID=3062638 RepID=UPI0026E39A73|nr:hypothetical protein [Gilvimarinus sp. 1_MG-2023]MDO6747587.1 hypothetical protein [Gilvimarinus sp. 1_MG-2023]